MDPLNDETAAVSAAIDRELRDALTIKPSAGFNVRLRERVALERRPRVWFRWPMLAMASGAIAAIVLAVVLMRSPAREVRTAVVTPPQVAAPSPARVDAPAGSPPAAVSQSVPRAPENGSARRPESKVRDVEVIVPRGQAAAILRFADNLRDDLGNRGWIPVLAAAAPNSDSFVFPSVPTIDRLPTVANYDPERE